MMTKSDHRKPINFVGMYFIDEHGEDYRTGQIIAQISDGYYLTQFDCTHGNVPPPPLEVLCSADFNKVCDNCGSRHWLFFADPETRKRWITWLNTPDPAKDKMGKVVHLKPSQINRREGGHLVRQARPLYAALPFGAQPAASDRTSCKQSKRK
jgi:hypothetical protein